MEKKKIITLIIAVLAVVLFVVLLISITKSKKTATPENNVTPAVIQKTEPKNEPKTETKTETKTDAMNANQPIMAAGQIVSLTDQSLTLKTEYEELNLKFKADTMITIPGSGTPPTPAGKDKSALVVGKTVRIMYQRDTMEVRTIIVQ